MSAAVTTPIGVLALGSGAALIWSAFTGQNPITELRATLSTGRLPGGRARPVERATLPINAAGGVSTPTEPYGPFQAGSAESGGGPPTLVPLGQGSHRLQAPAVTAFRQVEQTFGRSIPITDSARDYAAQAAAHARDPRRFGAPQDNAHVMGLAVDVNLGAIGARPTGSTPAGWLNDPVYRRLHDAFRAAGWCNWQMNRGDLGGKIPEPWHFSYGRCG